MSGDQDVARPTLLQVKPNQRVNGLAAGVGVIFANRDQAATALVDHGVRVAQVNLRRDWFRCLADTLTIDPLVGEVRKVDRSAIDDKGAAAVLVDAGPGV